MNRLRSRICIAMVLGLVALLAACSSIAVKQREHAERARLEAYAGQPIDHFTWSGRYYGWKPVRKEQVLVWTTPDQGYLIKVASPCEDLRVVDYIGLTSSLHTVYSRGLDHVKARGSQCPITEIRPVDYGRLQADLRQDGRLPPATSSVAAKTRRATG
jgi:hypothetical protein